MGTSESKTVDVRESYTFRIETTTLDVSYGFLEQMGGSGPGDKYKTIKIYDISSGEILGSNVNEAARAAIRKGISRFVNFDFSGARQQFQSAFMNSTGSSNEEREAKTFMSITDKMTEAVTSFDGGRFAEAREKLSDAHANVGNGDLKSAVGRKRNELAERLNEMAMANFANGNWSRANALFNEAYFMCIHGYSNEAEFKARRDVAADLAGMNYGSEATVLSDALRRTSNQQMRNVLSEKLRIKQASEKEAQERVDIERGIDFFAKQQFEAAKSVFNSVYQSSASGSQNEATAKRNLDVTNKAIDAVSKFYSGDYSSTRSSLADAYLASTDSRMKAVINEKRNSLAGALYGRAVGEFEQGNWVGAESLFAQGHLMSISGYSGDTEFRFGADVARSLQTMNAENEVSVLTDALGKTSNSRMRAVISERLARAQKIQQEKQQRVQNEASARRFFEHGQAAWNQAWDAELDESSDRSSEASQLFTQSKEFFERATQIDTQSDDYGKWLSISSLKISGNEDFNRGFELQKEAARLQLQSRFYEAKAKYEEAKRKFEEGLVKSGDQRFNSSISFVAEQIEVVEKITSGQRFSNISVHKDPSKQTGETVDEKVTDTTVIQQAGH